MVKKTVAENFEVPSHDANGGGVELPEPAPTGDVHANRAPDQTGNTDGETVVVPGVGPVSRAETLRALLSRLASLPADVLATIADGLPAEDKEDWNVNPSGATDGDQAVNLASIATHEDIQDIFAGQELSEDFKSKAAIVWEATLGARMTVLEAELEEKHQEKIQEAVAQVSESLVEQIDKYLTFTAEQYIQENKHAIETTLRSTVAEEFMAGVLSLAGKFNIQVPETHIDVVEALSNQVEELKAKLNENFDVLVSKEAELKEFRKEKAFSAIAEGLTLTQVEKLKTLSEHVDYADLNDFTTKVTVLRESVSASTLTPGHTVISEGVHDGVQPLSEETQDKGPAVEPEMKKIMEAMKRIQVR